MQFWDPEKEKKFSLDRTLEQLGQGIAGNLQRRRQSLDTKFGLRALGYSDPEAEMLSGMNPQLLSEALKQRQRDTIAKAWADEVNQAEGRGGYGQQQQAQPIQAVPDFSQTGSTLPLAGKLQNQTVPPQQQNITAKKPYTMLPSDVAKAKLYQITQDKKNQIRQDELGLKKQEAWTKRIDKNNEDLGALEAVRMNLNEIRNYFRTGQVISDGTQQALHAAGLDKVITNASTQAVGKASAQMILNQIGRMKGMGQVRNFIAQTVERMKPSLLNTPEGIEAVGDSLDIGMDAIEEIINLQNNEYERIGNNLLKDPYSAPTDPNSFIKDKIKNIWKNARSRIDESVLKHSGVTFKSEDVKAIDDPSTFNTTKDGVMFQEDDGTYKGSDGKRIRKARVKMVGETPIFNGWLD